jgi:hypothetical protein
MTKEETKLYEVFVKRLNGESSEDGKPPFTEFSSGAKSLGKMKLSQKVKDELRGMLETKFERGAGTPAPAVKKNKTPSTVAALATTVATLVADQQLPPSVPASRTPVYGTIPEGVAAKLTFLREAIENNVNVIHGLMEAKQTNPDIDVSEIQDTVNRLNLLNFQHDAEVDYILKTVFPSGSKYVTPASTLTQPPLPPPTNGAAVIPVQAPVPPTPGLGRSPFSRTEPKAVAGFRMPPTREQTEADPREVEMLRRTKPEKVIC